MMWRFQMPMALKAFLLVAVTLIAGFTFVVAREFYRFRGYYEAEALVPVVWKLAEDLSHVQPRPATLEDLLSRLTPGERRKVDVCLLRWTPGHDPVFALKVNDHYGFAIGAEGNPSWQSADKMSALFCQ